MRNIHKLVHTNMHICKIFLFFLYKLIFWLYHIKPELVFFFLFLFISNFICLVENRPQFSSLAFGFPVVWPIILNTSLLFLLLLWIFVLATSLLRLFNWWHNRFSQPDEVVSVFFIPFFLLMQFCLSIFQCWGLINYRACCCFFYLYWTLFCRTHFLLLYLIKTLFHWLVLWLALHFVARSFIWHKKRVQAPGLKKIY